MNRFPRLLRGKEAAAAAALLWQDPKFSVEISTQKPSVSFRFKISVPLIARESKPGLVGLFFDPGSRAEDWAKVVARAYRQTQSGNRTIHRQICSFLRVAYKNAIGLYLSETWEGRDETDRAIHLRNFAIRSSIKRSQPDPRLAIEVSRLYKNVKVRLKKMQNEMRKPGTRSQRDIRLVKDQYFPNIDHAVLRSFGVKESVAAKAMEIVEVSVKKKLPVGPNKPSLLKYIRLGNRLVAEIMEEPLRDTRAVADHQ